MQDILFHLRIWWQIGPKSVDASLAYWKIFVNVSPRQSLQPRYWGDVKRLISYIQEHFRGATV